MTERPILGGKDDLQHPATLKGEPEELLRTLTNILAPAFGALTGANPPATIFLAADVTVLGDPTG